MLKKKRNYSLDFLKIFAASGIVLHHFQTTTGIRYSNFINFAGSWFNWGYLTELFFILSGYFMYRYVGLIRDGQITLFDWWKKRALRLLPMTAMTVVVFELILFINNAIFEENLWWMDVSIWGAVISALGLSEGWGFVNPNINISIWYISVLMACCIIFYILTALSSRIKCNPIYFYVAMVILGIGIGVYGLNLPFLNWQIARGYYAFFFGLLLAAYVNKNGIKRGEIIASITSIVFFTLIVIFFQNYAQEFTNYMITFLFFPALIILLETPVSQKIFCHKIWGTLSAISFEVYLWHLPIMLLFYFVMNLFKVVPDFVNKPEALYVSQMFAFLLVMWVIGAVMYFFVERPITKRLTQKEEKIAKGEAI